MFKLLLLSGSLRDGSTNTATLRTAAELAPATITTVMFERIDRLPFFDPDRDHDPLPEAVRELRQAVHDADAILICTPEYAGALPGALKNLLEWLIGDAEPGSISGKRVGYINISAAPTAARDAHDSLRKVLRYAGAELTTETSIPIHRYMIDDRGVITDAQARAEIAEVLDRFS